MKQLVKRLAFALAPRLATAVMSARARAHSHRVVAGWGGRAVADKRVGRYGSRVQEGPFAGLILTPMTYAEQIGPHLLGVYESELDEAWDVVLRGTYGQIVDVGAKFGYYAVALAQRFPGARVIAFDTDWWARRAVREMAAANGTTNVQVEGHCSPDGLEALLREPAFVLSDCEGYESELFTPPVVEALRTAVVLIETHDGMVPGVSGRLRAAFGATHAVLEYGASGNRRSSSRHLDFLSAPERQLALHEVRGPQRWLLCLPSSGPNGRLNRLAEPRQRI